MIKITDKVKEEAPASEEAQMPLIEQANDVRTIALFGDVDEEKAGDLSMGFLLLKHFIFQHMEVQQMRCSPFMI